RHCDAAPVRRHHRNPEIAAAAAVAPQRQSNTTAITQEDIMRTSTGIALTLATAVGLGAIATLANFAAAEDSAALTTYRDIEQTLGSVPSFFKAFPESGIAGAWNEFKSLQLNPKTKLDSKTKELIGLAVSAQIPCQYCVYFHTAA